MWSSTDSTATTLSIGNNYQRPCTTEIFNECCKERSLFQPTDIQYDFNWNLNIVKNAFKEIQPKSVIEKPNKVCYQGTSKDNLIINWANENLKNDNRTFQQIIKDEKLNKKEREEIKDRLHRQEFPSICAHLRHFNEIPYIERSFCYPKIMCYLGHKIPMQTQQILHYIHCGITLFILDLRFGSPCRHTKLIKCFDKIRQEAAVTKKIFGLAFIIHGRKMEVGLMYKNRSVYLDINSIVILTADRRFSDRGTHKVIYINFSNYIENFEPGDEIQIGNTIIVTVQNKVTNSVVCIVKKEGLLNKSMVVKIPFNRQIFPPPSITTEEDEDIAFAISMGCDYLISTCVTENLRAHIDWALAVNNRLVIILQKMSFSEQPSVSTVEEIQKMFNVSDGLYIFGECPPESYELQKYAMKTAIRRQKVIVQASYMMKEYRGIPDKEALKCFLLYPDTIVVSPVYFDVTKVRSLIRNIYPEMNRDNYILSFSPFCQQNKSVESEFCRQILLLTICEQASCIIVVNNSGHFVRLLAENRPMVPIIASFLDSPYARNCLHSRNVYVTLYRNAKPPTWIEEVTTRLRNCIEYGQKIDCIQKDVPFIFCYNSKAGLKFCNTVRILLNA